MPTKSTLLITLFSTVFIILLGLGIYIYWDSAKPLSSITIQEKSSKTVKPDKAKIDLIISLKDINLSKIKTESDAKTNKVIELLTNEGISKDKIITNSTTYPDYTYYPNTDAKNDLQKTVLDSTITVSFENIQADIQKPNRILNKAIELGVSRFGQFQYDYTNLQSTCQNLRDEADKNALQRAKDKVGLLSGKLVKVSLESNNDASCSDGQMYYGAPVAMKSSMDSVGSGTPIPETLTGEKELSATSIAKAEYKL
jgi:uncharacterized protein YggE